MEQKLNEELELESLSLRRSRRTLVITACILLPFVACYLSWIYVRVNSLIQPESVASMIRYEVGQRLPGLKDSLSQELRSYAPQVAHEFGSIAISNIPVVRIRLQEKLEDTFRLLVIGYENKLQNIISDMLVPGSRELYVQTIDSLGDKDVARQLSKTLFAEVMGEFDRAVKEEIELSLNEVLQTSSATLQKMLGRLELLSSKTELSESEALQKEFIVVLMEFLRKSVVATSF